MSGTELVTAQLEGAYMLRLLSGENVPLVPERLMMQGEMLCAGLEELAERYPTRATSEELGLLLSGPPHGAYEDLRDLLMKVAGGKLATLDAAALLIALMAPDWATGTGAPNCGPTVGAHLAYVSGAEVAVMLKGCRASVRVGVDESGMRRQKKGTTGIGQIKRLARELLGVEV